MLPEKFQGNSFSAFPQRIRRRVASNSYQLMRFPVLWIEDISSIPPQKNNVR